MPSQGEKFASSVLLATMTILSLNLKDENDPWPVSLFAPQGLPFTFPIILVSEGSDQIQSLLHCFHI
jgi:hypothetical protein